MTGQLPVNDWHDNIGDPTLAAKESMREREATKLVAKAKTATQP